MITSIYKNNYYIPQQMSFGAKRRKTPDGVSDSQSQQRLLDMLNSSIESDLLSRSVTRPSILPEFYPRKMREIAKEAAAEIAAELEEEYPQIISVKAAERKAGRTPSAKKILTFKCGRNTGCRTNCNTPRNYNFSTNYRREKNTS